jgi:hypothetical protein
MGKRSNWRVRLFLTGTIVSCLIALGEIALIALGYISDLSWVTAALLAFAALLPAALFSLPYANSRFIVSYSKESGLTIAEETKKPKERQCRTSQN